MNCIQESNLLAVIIVCLMVIGPVTGPIARHFVQLVPVFSLLRFILAGAKWPHPLVCHSSLLFLTMVLVLATAPGTPNVAPGSYS